MQKLEVTAGLLNLQFGETLLCSMHVLSLLSRERENIE